MTSTEKISRSLIVIALTACAVPAPTSTPSPQPSTGVQSIPSTPAERLARYTSVRLVADESGLTQKERQMLPLLIDAARAMNEPFWAEAYGNGDSLLRTITDPALRRLVEVNYGPWDRLDDNAPFVPGFARKPP